MSLRKERLGDEIKDLIATCFVGDKLRDPRVQGVTITAVKLSGDLQMASVYFRLFEKDQKDDALKGLDSCKGFLRRELSKALDVRRVPELRFFYDDQVEEGSRIEALLAQLNNG